MTLLTSQWTLIVIYALIFIVLTTLFSYSLAKMLKKKNLEKNKKYQTVPAFLFVLVLVVMFFVIEQTFVEHVYLNDVFVTEEHVESVDHQQKILSLTNDYVIVDGIYSHGYVREVQTTEGHVTVRVNVDDYQELRAYHHDLQASRIIDKGETRFNFHIYYDERLSDEVVAMIERALDQTGTIEEAVTFATEQLNRIYDSHTFDISVVENQP
ncbi:hypothetical protein [Desertibacillus haloalkaliphilus]|uniref:hypothetical protein n=1 Tax=Desertibacillus haloalkaliphilus TaxID=1328930 RepID=UPI001C251BEC|nr:hypothetical protein [Desertibacillus haloalkaliphilus]MBU8904976.1 hypothetical protein [Desertibacillus haloalkaliphilus]